MNAENLRSQLPKPPLIIQTGWKNILGEFAPIGNAKMLRAYLNPDQLAHLVPLFALRTAHSLAIYQAQEQAWGHAG